MKHLLLVLFVFGSFISLNGQNTSAGIGINLVTYDSGRGDDNGELFSVNIRTQFSDKLAWQTELGYLNMGINITSIEEVIIDNGFREERTTVIRESKNTSALLRTSFVYKLLSVNDLNIEAIVGGGLFRDVRNDIFGLLHGEIFLSVQINKHLVAGIPISYDFVTWERDAIYSAGFSLRYHY